MLYWTASRHTMAPSRCLLALRMSGPSLKSVPGNTSRVLYNELLGHPKRLRLGFRFAVTAMQGAIYVIL